MPKGTFSLPKGAKFDLRTRTWSDPNRTLYDKFKAGEAQYSATDGEDGKIILMENVPGATIIRPDQMVTVTREEYLALNPMFGLEAGPDELFAQSGLLGVTVVGRDDFRLCAGERGLVLRPGIERLENGDIRASLGLDSAELRAALFLWDKLDWPKHNIVSVPETPETTFLEAEGVMRRSAIQHIGARVSRQDVLDIDLTAWSERDRLDPGRWVLGRGASAAEVNGAQDDQADALLIRIANLVEVPDVEVPLEEILAFRVKRRPELLALRQEIDAIYTRILGAVDRPHAWVSECDALVRAIETQRRVLRETGWKSRLSSIAPKIEIKHLAPAAMAAAEGYLRTASLPQALTEGGAVLGVTVSLSKKKDRAHASPLEYLIAIEREFTARGAVTP